ncbi:MFS transporter [Bosea sp. 685]|uniref:MFS transporter n=1 Tax=Bosea sp. 685 TaxID=3080057 RepID=UPI002892FA5D|nr:MFS transporter [Bosea sp. 685]WNJ87933.1 MFS transporter [Bosea sp. 685]
MSAVTIDVGSSLDKGDWTFLQKRVLFLALLTIVVDGFDGQLIGYAIPTLMKEWDVSRAAFASVVAAGLVGMAIGAAASGAWADRFGRRSTSIASVIIFGGATACIGLVDNLPALGGLRFVAGLGLGGALPGALTLAAEFTPSRRRALAVAISAVGATLGGMLAGLVASYVLPAFGWRTLFFMGGAIALALGAILFVALPESPKYLVRRPHRWPELARLLARIGVEVGSNPVFVDVAERQQEKKQGFSALISRGWRRDTGVLWLAFFCSLFAIYSAFSWLPTMLVAAGLNPSAAVTGLTAYNVGGVIGSLGCALAIPRLGSRLPLVLCGACAAAIAFALQAVDVAQNPQLVFLGLGIHGLFVNAVQSNMYIVCAHVYPTAARASGMAWALAIGRFGAISSSFIGAAVITGGSWSYFGLLGIAMLMVCGALLLITRHLPSQSQRSQHAQTT